MALDIGTILFGLVGIVVVLAIFVAPSLWIAGRLLAGKQKAKFTDALWIVIIGGIVFYFFNVFVQELLSSVLLSWLSYIVLLVIWLALVKHFFNCGWLKALAISIIALIIAVIILFVIFFVLTFIGISTGWMPIGTQFNSF
jgi:hypothetical protein